MKKIYLLLATIFTLGVAQSQAQNCQAFFMNWVNGNTMSVVDSSWVSFGNYNVSWDFGDGTIDTSSFATQHTYANPGTYIVCLTIASSNGMCSDTWCDSVSILSGSGNPCSADFVYTANNRIVSFTNVSSNLNAQTYFWDFGDNTTSTTTNPVHTYSAPGAYGVTLTSTTTTGTTCSYYDTVYVNYCNAYFNYSTGANGAVSFTNLSTASNATDYYWTFGDNSSPSWSQHATHTYAASGTYNVTLNLYDSLTNCNSSFTDSLYVQVGGTGTSCNASFTKALDSSASFNIILYNTSSNASSHSYFWDFGDGTSGSGRTPIHQYQNFGSYIVCLTVTDNQLNCTSTFCDTVGMDSLGNLKSAGFGIEVRNPVSVGVEEVQDLNTVSVYPNPATTNLSVDLTSVSEQVNLKLVDVTGKTVFENKNPLVGTIARVDLASLENGIYFLIMNDGANQKTEKVIKF